MAETKERTWKTIESGPHTYKDALHPVVAKNDAKRSIDLLRNDYLGFFVDEFESLV